MPATKFADVADLALVTLLQNGAIGIIPTDTLYGIVASAYNQQAVERLFTVRQRDAHKSCIVLIGDSAQLQDRQLWQPGHMQLIQRYWPGPVSVILPTSAQTPAYLQRDDHTVAYRLPHSAPLRRLLLQTGPLIAPSANPQGQTPAATLQAAIRYFGNKVDFYVDGGDLSHNHPSTLVRLKGNKAEVLRGQLPQMTP